MSTTPPDEPTPGSPDYGDGYGAPPPPGGYGAPPPGGYGAPPPGGPYGVPGGWSVGTALGYGWRKFTQHLGPILVLSLILFIGIMVFGAAGALVQAAIGSSDDGWWARQGASAIFSLLNFLVSTVLGAFIARGALDLTEGRSLELGSIFSRIPLGPVLVLGLLTSVITAVGFFLLVIPGLLALLFLYFSTYFLLDRGLSPVDAMSASVRLVRDHLGDALLWAIVAFLVSLVGVCLCFVGLLVTYPVAIIGTAFTYKRLTGQEVVA